MKLQSIFRLHVFELDSYVFHRWCRWGGRRLSSRIPPTLSTRRQPQQCVSESGRHRSSVEHTIRNRLRNRLHHHIARRRNWPFAELVSTGFRWVLCELYGRVTGRNRKQTRHTVHWHKVVNQKFMPLGGVTFGVDVCIFMCANWVDKFHAETSLSSIPNNFDLVVPSMTLTPKSRVRSHARYSCFGSTAFGQSDKSVKSWKSL